MLSSFALLFGVGDGGYLLGTALHFSMPDSLSNFIEYGFLGILGVYWIIIAIISRKAAEAELQAKSQWGVWLLPWALANGMCGILLAAVGALIAVVPQRADDHQVRNRAPGLRQSKEKAGRRCYP